jgi:hypothetical protein
MSNGNNGSLRSLNKRVSDPFDLVCRATARAATVGRATSSHFGERTRMHTGPSTAGNLSPEELDLAVDVIRGVTRSINTL